MLIFLLFQIILSEFAYSEFKGGWLLLPSNRSVSINHHTKRLYLYFRESHYNDEYNSAHSIIQLTNGSRPVFKPSQIHLVGLYEKSTQTYLFYHPQTPHENHSVCIERISTALNLISANDRNRAEKIYNIIKESVTKNSDQLTIFLYTSLSNTTQTTSPFDLPIQVSGTLFAGSAQFKLRAIQFNKPIFIDETRIFMVFVGIIIVLNYFIWKEEDAAMKPADYSGLSPISVVMNNAFDFAFSHYVLDTQQINTRIRFSAVVCFSGMMYTYFCYELQRLMRAWKAALGPGDTRWTDPETQHRFSVFLTVASVICVVSFVSFEEVYSMPIAISLFLFSFWVPQIYVQAMNPDARTVHPKFAFFTTLTKLLPFWYFFCYPRAITEKPRNPHGFIAAAVWSLVQVVVLTLQRRFGGDFFMARKKERFDYQREVPPDGAVCLVCLSPADSTSGAVVTPCHHCFHEECLRRWMDEKTQCPVCRTQLPPLPLESKL